MEIEAPKYLKISQTGLEFATFAKNEHTNAGFEMSPEDKLSPLGRPSLSKDALEKQSNGPDDKDGEEQPQRAMWGNQIEFLMSCIATSVGLGNVWRFPFIAFQNGGGAFLIPYVIVLLLVGKPMYYLECVLGQFSSKNSVKVWSLSPALKGIGFSQAMGCGYILSYYVSIVALCLFYLAMSFSSVLPWAVCQDDWENCIPSGGTADHDIENATSSAEFYFTRTVLRQLDNIDDGIGVPLWDLTLCLLASWFMIFLIVAQGVKSSGKAAYFLAIFPYIIMVILLIRSATLEGAGKGILFFLTPQWDKLLQLEVWYAAVTQVFFSLSVCTGAIIMFSSYNDFRQNIYRDAMIVTTLDTFTSLMSGITIFGILGNLAFELGYDDISEVLGSGGAGLAFVSYPDAIAKSPFAPQLFAVLFFLMMTVLGIGSSVALLSTLNTLLYDAFPRVRTVYLSAIACSIGFLLGLVYVTPGGQFVLELVDYYGGTFLVLFAAISEIIGVFWIYGLESLCLDIEYMLNRKTSFYWRICWGILTPFMMIAVFIFALITSEALVFGDDIPYPSAAHVSGYLLLFAGILLVPIFIVVKLVKNRTGNCVQTVKTSFKTKPSWGPRSASEAAKWRDFKSEAKVRQKQMRRNMFTHPLYILIGGYRWKA